MLSSGFSVYQAARVRIYPNLWKLRYVQHNESNLCDSFMRHLFCTAFQVEVERRKESITSSPLLKQAMTEAMPPAISINLSTKTADKPRKGLPAFIWVIGMENYFVEKFKPR